MLRLRYHYPGIAWYAVACAVLGVVGLVAAGFVAAAIGSMARRGVSGAMIGIGGAMALMAAAFVGGAGWYWMRVRALDQHRDAYGIVVTDGRLTSTDWDAFGVTRVTFALADVESAVEGSYKGRRFVRIRTRADERYALPMQRLGGEDRDRLRLALAIRTP